MDISSQSILELERLIDEYPWFTLARKAYIQKVADGDREQILSFVKSSSLHLLSRVDFLHSAEGLIGSDFSKIKKSVVKQEKTAAEAPSKSTNRPYIVGGDYFSKEDFQQLSNEGLSIEVNLNFPQQNCTEIKEISQTEPSETDIYTETLAKIYSDQGLYSQAIEIYNKLILLYPEKNAYFASLIENVEYLENIKNKIN